MLSALIVVLAIIKIQINVSNAHNSANNAHHLQFVILVQQDFLWAKMWDGMLLVNVFVTITLFLLYSLIRKPVHANNVVLFIQDVKIARHQEVY